MKSIGGYDMKRFLFSWVVILALALSGCEGTNASSDASGGADSQQSTATETDVAEAEAAEQTAEQSAEDDAEEPSDSETVLMNLCTKMMYGDGLTHTYTYDSSGNITSIVSVDTSTLNIADDFTVTYVYTSTYHYTYDESGNLTEEDCIFESEDDSFGTTFRQEIKSEYDAVGKLVSEEIINFVYDSDGEETTPYGIFVYSYDGNVGTATATVQSDGETYTETRTVTYNGEGVLLSKEVYDEGENDSYYPSRRTYDETGRKICTISMMSSRYGITTTCSYTNDSLGNLLTYSTEKEEGYIDGEIYSYYYVYYEYSYNEDNELETISKYSSYEEGGTLTLDTIVTYRYHYLGDGLLESVDIYDEDGEREADLFYFEYEAAVQLPADEAEAVQAAQTDLIRSFLRN